MKRIGVLWLLLSATVGLWAQAPTGGIEGTVSDATGAVIPGAKVTVTETATGRTIELTTNSAGRYSARNLLPSLYRLRIEAPNFSAHQVDNVSVSAGAVVNGDATLQVGRTGEVVSVTAEAVMVDTSRQTVDSVITERELKNLPLGGGRNFLDLAALAPGVNIRDGGAIDPTKEFAYRTVGVVGRSGTGTRIQIDGIDITDETVGTTTANISADAVREFQLSRSSLDVSTSLTSSGAVNIISKSGTNDIHGSWFWDYHNQDMAARLDYNPESAPFKRNRTGGAAGGPLVKDKLFWFANWERTYQTAQEVFGVPEFPQLNVSQAFPVGIRYTKGRVDWNATSRLRVFYSFQHDWNLSTGGTPVSPFQNINWTNTNTIGLDFSQTRLNHSFRFGYVNFNNRIDTQELDIKFPRTPQGIPVYVGVGPFQAGPNSLAPQQTYQDNFQNSYNGSAVINRHTLRYGFDLTQINLGGFANFAGPLEVAGTYTAADIAAIRARGGNVQDPLEYPFEFFETGPATGFFTLAPGHGLPHGFHPNTRYAWYVNDTVKFGRLSLNLGVRWQYDDGYFPNDRKVPRDPNMERWGRGFSKFPKMPRDLFSPSFGFAWDPTGSGKTVIRGGFYRGFEMNIFNNVLFDEFSMLPPGIGPDFYDHTHVTGPDGRPINVAGHPTGDYSDLEGRRLRDVLGIVGDVHLALQQAYSNFQFDPSRGPSSFTLLQGNTFGGQIPGDQFRIPYGLQFNIGVQRELAPGTVLTADYLENRGIGLPFFLIDYERRRDAGTLNVAAARTRVNTVLAGMTVDQWIAANPTRNISAFSLVNDTIWAGITGTEFLRARFMQGGFSRYRGLQVSLRGQSRAGRFFRDLSYRVSYALGRGESASAVSRVEFLASPFDNRDWNKKQNFGPNNLDFTHQLSVSSLVTVPGGFRFNQRTAFRTAPALTLTVPNLGGAISGSNGFFGTDLNGDGSAGTTPRGDVLPGLNVGQFGRGVKSFKKLNEIITNFNQNFAGKLTPHGQALVSAGLFTEAQLRRLGAVVPTIPLVPEGNPWPFHNFLVTDLRFDRPIGLGRLREGMSITPFVDFLNLFNHMPADVYSGLGATFGSLNFNYATEGDRAALDARRHRIGGTSPTAASTRKVQIGVRFDF